MTLKLPFHYIFRYVTPIAIFQICTCVEIFCGTDVGDEVSGVCEIACVPCRMRCTGACAA